MMQNNKRNKDQTIDYGADYVSMKSSYNVKIHQTLTLSTDDDIYDLDVEIAADFEKIPEKYHEIFLNMMTSKYMNKVSFSNNPFSKCMPVKKRKWWQFWRKKNYKEDNSLYD